MLDKRLICVDVAGNRQLGRRGRMLEINENKGADSRFAFWWWIGVFVGLPLAEFVAGCWQMFCVDGICPVFAQGVPFLIGGSMGYLVLASSRGLLRLPRPVERVRGWCVVALCVIAAAQVSLPSLVMCRTVAQYANAPCMADGLPPVNISPVLFLCFSPPVFMALSGVMRTVFCGFICVLALRIVVWAVPMLPAMLRDLRRTLSPGWGKLSVGLLVLIALLAFFIEPIISIVVLDPLRSEAKGIAEIDDLVREHDTIRVGNRECPQDNDDPVIKNPRESLLALYGKYGACTKPGYEHISTSELARLSPIDREFLSRILTAWNRQKALEVLKKATGENGNGGAR